MEEIAALLIQLFVEVGLQLFGSIGLDFLAWRAADGEGKKDGDGGWGWLVAFAAFGGVCGGLSLLVGRT